MRSPWWPPCGSGQMNTPGGENGVERRGELGVPVADEETETTSSLFQVGGEGAGNLGHPGVVGVGGDAQQMHDPAFDLDHEEDVVAAEQHGVDREEVGRQHTLGLGSEELCPGRAGSPRSGR